MFDPSTISVGKAPPLDDQLQDDYPIDIFGDFSDLFQGSGSRRKGAGDEDDGAEDSDDSNAALGRISDTSLKRIQEGLQEVQKLAKNIATETGLSPSQVFRQWMSTSQRTHTKHNPWNLYSAYFKDNEQQERLRLTERESDIHSSL